MEEKVIFEGIEFYPIPNYLNYYASRCGKIYSGKTGIIMKTRVRKEGYECVGLAGGKKGVCLDRTVHSLIALTFIGVRPKGYDINHKDFNKLNNYSTNLEYLTRYDNIRHSYENKKFVEVFEYDLHGNFVASYPSIAELGRIRGIDKSSISKVLKGKLRTLKGHFYSTEKKDFAQPRASLQDKAVFMCDLKGEVIKRFDSVKQASIYSGADSSSIIRCCKGKVKTAAYYTFKYAE